MTQQELQVIISAQTSGLKKEISNVKTQLTGLDKTAKSSCSAVTKAFSGVKKFLGAAGIVVGISKVVSGLKNSTSEAIKTEAQMSNLNRTMGNSEKIFTQWAKKQASAYGISESAAIKYGNAFSNLISGFINDTKQSTIYTKQLIESSAVIASRTGRTVEDVNERIRSGLLGNTEAIEDLGINVNVGTLEMTDAFKRIANGRSWEKLTYYEQQQVRLFAIMEQSAQKYGNELANNTSTKIMVFQARLENLKVSLGRVFIPIVNTVIPILTAFIDKISIAVEYVNKFISAFSKSKGTKSTEQSINKISKGTSNIASGLEEANKQAQSLKRTTASFDEMNIISTDNSTTSNSDNSTGSSSLLTNADITPQIDTTETDKSINKIKGFLEKLKNYITTKFKPSIDVIQTSFNKLKEPANEALSSIKNTAVDLYENSFKPLGKYLLNDFVPNIVNSFTTTLAPIFTDILSFAMKQFASDFQFVGKQIQKIVKDIFIPCMDLLKTVTTDALTSVKNEWDKNGSELLNKFGKFRDSIKEIVSNIYDGIIKPITDNIINRVKELWNKSLKPLWDNLVKFVSSLYNTILTLWNNVLAPLVKWITAIFSPIIVNSINSIIDIVQTVIRVIADVVSGILKSLRGLLDFITGIFTGDWKKAWSGIKTFFKGIWDSIWGIVKGVINLIIDGLNLLWGAIYSVCSGIVNGMGKLAGAIGKLIGKDWSFKMPSKAPYIPKLATGGIATKSVVANIGEDGAEAVLPLEKNTSWMDKLADKINGNTPTKIILQVGKTKLGEVVVDSLNELRKQNGTINLQLA